MSTRRIRRSNSHKGTKKQYINKLKNLYPSCKFDKQVEDITLYNGNNITYGEMEYEGIQELYNYLTKNYNPKINSFIDLGSGRGKLCMYMAAQPKIKFVLGVELVKQRHDDAEILKTDLKYEYANKVNLLNKNVLDIDFEEFKNKQIFIWFSNLCFEQTSTNSIFEKIKTSLPSGTIICCSKQPFPIVGTFLSTITVPMSWNKASNVHIYKV
jgi:tRNA G46 methylase TrmB